MWIRWLVLCAVVVKCTPLVSSIVQLLSGTPPRGSLIVNVHSRTQVEDGGAVDVVVAGEVRSDDGG